MKIIKVIVDELPENCCRCTLMGKDSDLGYCLSGDELETDYVVRRPDWCPLVVVPKSILNDIEMSAFLAKTEKPLEKHKLKEGCYDEHGGSLPSAESEE